MLGKFILEGGKVVPCSDTIEWAKWFEKADRTVGSEIHGTVRVSTVFLGLDHRFGGEGAPILFETMVFGGLHDGEEERYCTLEEAEEGHRQMCKKVFAVGGNL